MESQEPSGLRTRPSRPESLNISVPSNLPLPPSGREKRLGQEDIDIGVIDEAVLRRCRSHDCRCPGVGPGSSSSERSGFFPSSSRADVSSNWASWTKANRNGE